MLCKAEQKLHGNKISKPVSEVSFHGYEEDTPIQGAVLASWYRWSLPLAWWGRSMPWGSRAPYRAPWEARFACAGKPCFSLPVMLFWLFPDFLRPVLTVLDPPVGLRQAPHPTADLVPKGNQILRPFNWGHLTPLQLSCFTEPSAQWQLQKDQGRLEGAKEKVLIRPGGDDGWQVVSCPTCISHLPAISGSPGFGC